MALRTQVFLCARTVLILASVAFVEVCVWFNSPAQTRADGPGKDDWLYATRFDWSSRADAGAIAPGEVRDDNGLRLPLCWCPPMSFVMGSPPEEPGRSAHEAPVTATIRHGFWLGQFEVTQREWWLVMQTAPWVNQPGVQAGDDYPATWVDWQAAMTFCERLTDRERRAGRLPDEWIYRLPTEAEWECACRAGTQSTYFFGDDPAHLGEFGWYGAVFGNGSADGELYAHAVGGKRASPWNLYDMYGNVREWCGDSGQITFSGGINPGASARVDRRVVRGGGWNNCAFGYCRSADRRWSEAANRDSQTGFRVACCRLQSR